jgi:hypothetical protein
MVQLCFERNIFLSLVDTFLFESYLIARNCQEVLIVWFTFENYFRCLIDFLSLLLMIRRMAYRKKKKKKKKKKKTNKSHKTPTNTDDSRIHPVGSIPLPIHLGIVNKCCSYAYVCRLSFFLLTSVSSMSNEQKDNKRLLIHTQLNTIVIRVRGLFLFLLYLKRITKENTNLDVIA